MKPLYSPTLFSSPLGISVVGSKEWVIETRLS